MIGSRSLNCILMDVGKADNFRDAYPNYFVDIATFVANIVRITGRGRGLPTSNQVCDTFFF